LPVGSLRWCNARQPFVSIFASGKYQGGCRMTTVCGDMSRSQGRRLQTSCGRHPVIR
jgi:hypothetical protein